MSAGSVEGAWSPAAWRRQRLEQLGEARLGERALGLRDLRPHPVPGHGAADEHHEPGLRTADTGAAASSSTKLSAKNVFCDKPTERQ